MLVDPQSMNSYSYTNNNPVTLSDPSGNCPICVTIAVGAVAGALIAGGVTYWQTGDLKQAGNAAVGGAIAGAIFGAVGPASLLGTMATGGGAMMAGNSATRALNGEQITAGTLLTDGLLGAATAGLGYGVAKGVSALASRFMSRFAVHGNRSRSQSWWNS